MKVTLVIFKADGTRCDFPLDKSKTVIGRTMHCDLRIPLTEISRRHCEIRITPKDVILRDLGSCNGTYHNSNAIKNAKLQPGDEVVIGPVIFTVVMDGEPAHIYPRRTLLQNSATASGIDALLPPASDPVADIDQPLNIQPKQESFEDVDIDFDRNRIHIKATNPDRHRPGKAKGKNLNKASNELG